MAGNLLQGRDPIGLECGVDESCDGGKTNMSPATSSQTPINGLEYISGRMSPPEAEQTVPAVGAMETRTVNGQTTIIANCGSDSTCRNVTGPVYASPTPRAAAAAGEAVLRFGASFVPGGGEVQDSEVMATSDSPLEVFLATVSLEISVITGGFSPNYASGVHAAEAISDVAPSNAGLLRLDLAGTGLGTGGGSHSSYVYQLVDDAGEPVYYGLSNSPTRRLGEHALEPPGPFRGMQVISEALPLPQAQALETSLIQQANAEGRVIYNSAERSIARDAPVEVPSTVLPNVTLLNPQIYRR